MDQITLSRIQTLHPKIRKKVLDCYSYINSKLLGKGVRLRLAYTTRTIEEQNKLYSQGRTKLYDKNGNRLGKVTQAKGGESIHNYHLAFDIVILLDKDFDDRFESATYEMLDFDKDGTSDWMEVVKYLKSQGFVWGGDWKFKDKPHFEMTFGHTWRTLKNKIGKGDFFTESINGVKYTYVNL